MAKIDGMSSHTLLEIAGSPLQLGLAQGKAFASEKGKYFASMKQYPNLPPWIRPLIISPLVRAWLRYRGKRVKKLIHPVLSRDLDGDWEQRLAGLASGFGMDLHEVYGFNSVEILTAKTPASGATTASGVGTFAAGCTSLAFDADLTDEKTPILAYNHDYIPIFSPFLIVRKNRPKNFYASLSLTYQPAVGAIAGVNDQGLAVSLNHGYTIDDITPGIPLAFLVQTCLDRCASTQEAITLVERLPVPCGGIMTFIDAEGDRVAMELSPSRRTLREMSDKPLFSFNQYQLSEMQSVEIPQNAVFPWWFYPVILRGKKFHEFNWARRERYEVLTRSTIRQAHGGEPSRTTSSGQARNRKKWSRKAIIKILSDHGAENKPGRLTICRHQPETANTVASALIYPKKKTMEICLGNPCSGSYRTYRL